MLCCLNLVISLYLFWIYSKRDASFFSCMHFKVFSLARINLLFQSYISISIDEKCCVKTTFNKKLLFTHKAKSILKCCILEICETIMYYLRVSYNHKAFGLDENNILVVSDESDLCFYLFCSLHTHYQQADIK